MDQCISYENEILHSGDDDREGYIQTHKEMHYWTNNPTLFCRTV